MMYDSLRSTGHFYRLGARAGLRFAELVREARHQGHSWAEIGRDAQVDPRTAKRYATRVWS